MAIKVFLDTNIYLHFRHLSNLPLCDLLQTDCLTVVMPRITIRELDIQKNQNSSGKLRQRARDTLISIEAWSNGEQIAPNVNFERLSAGPAIDLAQYGLDPGWQDDVLIGTIVDYSEKHPDDVAVLITNDTGPRLKCADLGIKSVKPGDDLALAPEPDEVQLELRALRQQVMRLESAVPKVQVRFAGLDESRQHRRFELATPSPISDDMIRDAVARLERDYPEEKPSPDEDRVRLMIGRNFIDPARSRDSRNKEREKYFHDYVEYLHSYHAFKARRQLVLEVDIEIVNAGTAPAEDIDAWFDFPPDIVNVLTEFDLYGPPPMPERPKPVDPLDYMSMSRLDTTGWLANSMVENKRAMLPISIQRDGQLRVKYHTHRLKHGVAAKLPTLYVDLVSWEFAKSFQCQFEIRLANAIDPVCGKLHFEIQKGKE